MVPRAARHTATAIPAPVGVETLATTLFRRSMIGPELAKKPAVENGEPVLVPAM